MIALDTTNIWQKNLSSYKHFVIVIAKKKKKSYAGPVVRPWSMLLGPSPRNLRKWVLRSGCPDLDPATMCGYWLGVGGHLAHPPVLLAFMFPRCLLVLVPFFL